MEFVNFISSLWNSILDTSMEEETPGIGRIPSGVLGHILGYLDPLDRNAASEVCVEWKEVDSSTRTAVCVSNCLSVTPSIVSKRFPKLDTLEIRGYPGLKIKNNLEPWVQEIVASYRQRFKRLRVTNTLVTNSDLVLLSESCSESLTCLRLHSCWGFDTMGLASITKHCRLLEVLDLEGSELLSHGDGPLAYEKDVWIRNMAEPNSKLQELNVSPWFPDFKSEYVNLIVNKCAALKSLRLGAQIHFRHISEILNSSNTLLELEPGSLRDISQADPWKVSFPSSIDSLRLYELNDWCLPIAPATLAKLRCLDVYYADLSPEGYFQILWNCSNLEELTVSCNVGDDGLILVASACLNLKKIDVWYSSRWDPTERPITPRSIIEVVQNCRKLRSIVICASKLDNAALAAIGSGCPALEECELENLSLDLKIYSEQLDEGLKELLQGCRRLSRLKLGFQRRSVTRRGLTYIGKYGKALKTIELRSLTDRWPGDLDLGVVDIAKGCRCLEMLVLDNCSVTEKMLASAVRQSKSLKYIWANDEHYSARTAGLILAAIHKHWVVEMLRSQSADILDTIILAYCSVVAPRVSPNNHWKNIWLS